MVNTTSLIYVLLMISLTESDKYSLGLSQLGTMRSISVWLEPVGQIEVPSDDVCLSEQCKETEPSDEVCLSEQCERTAREISANMNLSVLPCDNFYQFVCGQFLEYELLPFGSRFIKVTDRMEKHTSSLIASYLEEYSSAEKNKPYQKAFKLYELCKNEDAMKEVAHLRQMIEKIGGWPVVEGEKWRGAKWENAAGELSKFGYNTGIFFNVEIIWAEFNNPIMIELRPIDFHQFTYKSEVDLEKVAIELGANASNNIGMSIGDTMVIFDNLTLYHSVDESTYEIFALNEIISRWPSIDWMTYLTGYFSISPTITIDENLFLSVHSGYINSLVNLLETTPNSAIMTYIVAQFVEESLPYLNKKYTMISDMNSSEQTEDSSSARRKYCIELTTHELPRMVEAIFAVNYVDDQLQKEFNDISNSLNEEMNELIKQADWMTNRTKKLLTEKLSNVTYEIGYPNLVKSNEYIKEYDNLELDDRSFLYGMWSMRRFGQQVRINSLRDKLSPVTTLSMYLTHRNAHYDEARKNVAVMPGFLQDPIINNELPKYINYGGVGFFIAHELAHGFPADMKSFVSQKNSSSKGKVRRTKFARKVRCLMNQYNKYIIKDINRTVNGEKTVYENIADNVGIKLAHLAYKHWIAQNGPEQILPNLNYTSMQMFWISFAKNQCAKYDPKSLDEIDRNDPHTLYEFRTNGPLSNNPEFSEAFNCPLGSPMNRVNKCVVW